MRNRRRTSTPPSNSTDSITDIERRILRVLCGGPIARATRERAIVELKGYRWREPEHKVVFEALGRIRSHDLKTLQAQLPAQTTRMGFPDVDWTAYFSGAGTPDMARLVRQMKARARVRS